VDTPTLGPRGARLWEKLTATARQDPAALVLIEEACRIADRLDRLDEVLRGTADAWLHLETNEDSGTVVVVVDRALSEARQQAIALKQIITELRQAAGGAQQPGQGGGKADELAARRRQRLADASGS
jgi:hypothetical protein